MIPLTRALLGLHTTIPDPEPGVSVDSLDMVKLTKIYTRSGDSGTTGLGTGKRVHKYDPRVEAYGSVDEANAALGLAVCTARTQGSALADLLESLQHDLFDVGADLCMPIEPDEEAGAALRITAERVGVLEGMIDEHNAELKPLDSFVLPGGTRLGAELHLARTVCRRAERVVAHLYALEPEATSVLTIRYLNRLSDLLFVLSRFVNDKGDGDVLWVPGKNRTH